MLDAFNCKNNHFHLAFLILFLFACKGNPGENKLELQEEKVVRINTEALILDQNQGLVLFEHIAFSGESFAVNADSFVVESKNFFEGVKHGASKKWFDDGTLSYEANYNHGKLEGWSKTYWKDGQIRSETFFVNGLVNGTQRQWYKSGQLFKELNYNMGVEEGMQKAWRENGAIYNNFEIVNGRIFGLKRANLCFALEEEVVQYEE